MTLLRSHRLHLVYLGIAGLIALAVRLFFVARTSELDPDAYGHLGIAASFLRNPSDITIHWFWLPGWHVLLGAATSIGLSHDGIRTASACLQAAAPFLLYDLVAKSGAQAQEEKARQLALLSALGCTVAPLSNMFGTSAQPETCFTTLLVGTVAALERKRGILAGILLSVACLLRYEAWGGAGALALLALVWRKGKLPLAGAFAPLATIGVYIVLRRWTDGAWLTFVGGTRTFVVLQREALGITKAAAALGFAYHVPLACFGPAFFLVPLGIKRFLRPSWIVPAGVLAFFVTSYAGGGALPLLRYWTSLTPFTCALMAAGALGVSSFFSGRWRRRIGALLLASLALTAAWRLGRQYTERVRDETAASASP